MDLDRTNSMGLWTHAHDFYQAADLLVKNEEFKLADSSYYLILHSIELALKAFLRGNCISLDDLRKKFGHDLAKILDEAKMLGLENHVELTKTDINAIIAISDYYKSKEFEYIVTGYKRYPKIELLLSFDDKLLRSIRRFCFDQMHCNDQP